jgi:hypothetical protein
MAGLDNIKHYDEGSTVEEETPPTPEDTEKQAPLSAKAVTSKGPYALPTPTGLANVDPSLLERMQSIINEREAQRNSFSESMRDAQAWWSGGVAGPSEALAKRAAEKEANQATTFGMRRDLAQYKMGQQNAQSVYNAIVGTRGATNAAATQTGNTTPAVGGAAAPTQQYGGVLLDLITDPGLKHSLTIQAAKDPNKALAAIQNILIKNSEDPQLVKEVRAAVQNGWIDPKLIPSVVLTHIAGPSAFVPHATFGPGGEGRGTPFGAAQSMSPGNANVPIPGTTPVGNQAASTPIAPRAPAPTTPMAMPTAVTPSSSAPAAPAITTPAAPAAPPLVPPTLNTGFTPGNVSDIKMREEAAKQKIAQIAEQQKPIQKAAGESAVALTHAAANAKNNINEYDMAEHILRRYPKAFGISQDGSVTAAVIQLVKPGTTIPILGTVKSEGIEEAVAQRSLPKKALEARRTFDVIATRQGVEFAKNNLTGEGRGTLSNADMLMSRVGKGLEATNPAATNLIFTTLNRENEMMVLQRNNAWDKYQQDAEKEGRTADFNAFRQTEAYKKPMDEKIARIEKRFPEFFEAAIKSGEYDRTVALPGQTTSKNKKYNPQTGKVE